MITQHIRMKLQQPDLRRIYHSLELIPSNYQIRGMHTILRDQKTNKTDFIFIADRLLRLVSTYLHNLFSQLCIRQDILSTTDSPQSADLQPIRERQWQVVIMLTFASQSCVYGGAACCARKIFSMQCQPPLHRADSPRNGSLHAHRAPACSSLGCAFFCTSFFFT